MHVCEVASFFKSKNKRQQSVPWKQQDLKRSDLKRCPRLQRRKCYFRLLKADLENGPEWLLGEQVILCSRYLEVSRGGGGVGVGWGVVYDGP